ncbi:MAG: dihydroneopterin aldolase [Chthonomonas sp.]|nr:dihydroneopterin aldolase [Chthonomonas sp.]
MTVFIRGIEVYAHHGVTAEERAVGHRYIADLEFEVKDGVAGTDDISATVDYGDAGITAAETIQETQFKTVEYLAHIVAGKLLDRYPQATSVQISLAKRLPPAPLIAETAGVTLRMTRGSS